MTDTWKTITVVGLGANLGERLAQLRAAVAALRDENAQILKKSHVYESPPAGGPPQPDYLNAAVALTVPYDLPALLERCLAIERRFGRQRPDPVRNGPRPLDLDLLWSSAGVFEKSGISVPHPRLRARPFALQPLLEVIPDARDPRDGAPYASLPAAAAPLSRLELL